MKSFKHVMFIADITPQTKAASDYWSDGPLMVTACNNRQCLFTNYSAKPLLCEESFLDVAGLTSKSHWASPAIFRSEL